MPQPQSDRPPELDQLEKRVRQLAKSHAVPEQPKRAQPLLSHLHDLEALLHDAFGYFASATGVQLALSYAAEWLLDNFYLIEEQIRTAKIHLPKGYSRVQVHRYV